MVTRKRAGWVGAAASVTLVVFFLVPVVPYSAKLGIQYNYGDRAYSICEAYYHNPTVVNSTIDQQIQSCLEENALPPTVVTGSAPLSYSLLGYGAPPFPKYSIVSQGAESALAFFNGPRIDFAVGGFRNDTRLNPPGVVEVEDAQVLQGNAGTLNFTALIRNIGDSEIFGFYTMFLYPGYYYNGTVDGIKWVTPVRAVCGTNAYTDLAAGDSCYAHFTLDPDPALIAGQNYTLTCIVGGSLSNPVTYQQATTQINNVTVVYQQPEYVHAGSFVLVKSFGVVYPGTGPNAQWMNEFVQTLNGYRGGVPLIEDPSLDAFAKARFETASSNFQISDYGFDNQSAQFFAGTGKTSTEEILYPSYYSAGAFDSVLQKEAPAHWAGLVNTGYTRFGYYIGTAPSVEFGLSCPVNEITQRNVNITQIAIQNGCQYKVETLTWLLIVLSS